MYRKGEGVQQNYSKTVFWFTKAAEQGYVIAQGVLALMYYEGQEGVQQDYSKAVHWFNKAAEQGDASAQYFLADMYYEGEGVIKDYVESYKWLLLAGKNDRDVSDLKVSLQKKMTPAQVAQAQRLARQFVAKHKNDSGSDR